MIKKVLIANRGEIAVRVIRACHQIGIKTVAIYSDADTQSLHVQIADEAVCIGAHPLHESYLNIQVILQVALMTQSDAIHPGFGFLSENANFARLVDESGLIFIGPSHRLISLMGDKVAARENMIKAGVPVVKGSAGVVNDVLEARALAAKITYPIMIKARSGGGGKGMRVCFDDASFEGLFLAAKKEAATLFGDDGMYLEQFVQHPRHVEVQVIGDRFGNYVHLGERDCTMQRRNQKMIEEAPSSFITEETRQKMFEASIQAIRAIAYDSVGTIEYLVDVNQNFYFMEMNTRIQVEHPVTEMITGIDLIREQIYVADNRPLSFKQNEVTFQGHAMECRINAENPNFNFRPSPGKITFYHQPGGFGIRVDSAIYQGYHLPPYYDSMLAKVIVHGKNRLDCIKKMRAALSEMIIEGIDTNTEFHYILMHQPTFVEGNYDTHFIEAFVEEVYDGTSIS